MKPVGRIPAIVIGAGPSFRELLTANLPPYCRLYGCGPVGSEIDLDVFAYGDFGRHPHLPKNPKCQIWYTGYTDVPGWYNFTSLGRVFKYGYSHAGSSGGMALSIACTNHDVIGIIGFDGLLPADAERDSGFEARTRKLMNYWIQERGKKLINLMDDSVFADTLLNWDDYKDYGTTDFKLKIIDSEWTEEMPHMQEIYVKEGPIPQEAWYDYQTKFNPKRKAGLLKATQVVNCPNLRM